MHKEILTKEQEELLPLLKLFSKQFGLVGGTAFALHLGHRRSIDFDLFSPKKFSNITLRKAIEQTRPIQKELINRLGEFTFMINGVKMTFFHYPFGVKFTERFDRGITLPDLVTLAAMKACALGQRAKWKDYVDMYFALQHHTLTEIIDKTMEIFGDSFNSKLFVAQLSYFEDVNYSEIVEYMRGFETDDARIKKTLIACAVR
ncbi:MAG: hypothetical protein HY422_00950 [Candidatus Komeilibacteria bacterium]|nr:hypothetical protein [Candidatus Komeilibacteria bacterium]